MTSANSENPRTNVPELSVSELSFSLKKTLEDTYARVRVRGELSKVKIHTSGHLYSDLKDADACLGLVCWKTSVARLKIRPEEGLEVICTGRISTYPQRSNYQLIVESMELAGEGALLKMLEDRRKRLAVEGLFDAGRKKPLPFLPRSIGVVTSATGAVIRDILHRLEDRFPRPVLVWPVLVQGQGAADQVAAAIRGFDMLPENGPICRPDLLIVARGGGSLEDLMPFNEESVVRAVAACRIPVISAVGHETDTTLCDFAADIRAPTPTAAAEMAVPVRAQLYAQVLDDERRMISGMVRAVAQRRERLDHIAARLGDPRRLLDLRAQRLDHTGHRLSSVFEKSLRNGEHRLAKTASRLLHPQALVLQKTAALDRLSSRLEATYRRTLDDRHRRLLRAETRLHPPRAALAERSHRLAQWGDRLTPFGETDRFTQSHKRALDQAARMLETLSFKSVLSRGFVVVRDATGQPVTDGAALSPGQPVTLQFRDTNIGAAADK